jgi:hypothetical protein
VRDRLGEPGTRGLFRQCGGLFRIESDASGSFRWCFSCCCSRRRRSFRSLLGFRELLGTLLSARNDHGLFEFVLFGLGHFLVREAQLVMADGDDITVLQRMLFNQLAV